jgi:RNA polymerase sigma factor (sigma-70 family)
MSSAATSPEQVILESRNAMLHAAMAVLRNPEDAEDCVQDASLRLLRFWGSFHAKCSTRTWALTLTHNQALAVLRSRRAAKRDQTQYRCDIVTRSHEGQILARLTLIRAAAKLTGNERQALALWVLGYRAKKQNSPGAYMRVYRAVQHMRDLCRGVC